MLLLCATAAVGFLSLGQSSRGLEVTSHEETGQQTEQQTALGWSDRLQVFEDFHQLVPTDKSHVSVNSSLSLPTAQKTSRSLCLNKKLAALTVGFEAQQERNEGVINPGRWVEEGTNHDDYANSRNKVCPLYPPFTFREITQLHRTNRI